jgi:hypothetical protein
LTNLDTFALDFQFGFLVEEDYDAL